MDLNILQFLELIGKLKAIKRTGWVLRNVKDPETVSGHMYRMSIMALILPDTLTVDKNRCIKLALVHDMAECIVGDITPVCGVSPEEKHLREDEAIKHMTSLLQEYSSGTEIKLLYDEYKTQETVEAQLVKDLDRLDMILQAFEYEKAEGAFGRLEEFFESTSGKFRHPWVINIVDQLIQERQKHIQLLENK